MSRKNIEDIYHLSPSQQGMLFETLASPGSGIHIEQASCALRGGLNETAFERAWQRVVDRHPVLRTAFFWEGQEQPVQVALRRVKAPLEARDWREYPPDRQQEMLRDWIDADRSRGFDLARAPLMRLTLLRMAGDAYRFIWTLHHILMDGWCISLVLKEVLVLYEAFSRGEEPDLEPVRPYKDYIAWLRRQDASRAEAFWPERLRGFEKPTPLGIAVQPSVAVKPDDESGVSPLASSSPSPDSGPRGRDEGDGHLPVFPSECPSVSRSALPPAVEASLPAPDVRRLKASAREHRITLNTLVQGTWGMLLSRYSGESDVVFGATVSGRPPELAGVESMVGLFINTLPVRLRLNGDEPLWPWLADIQSRQMEQRAFEYCSAGQAHGWSDVPASLPLYESILVFENYPVDDVVAKPRQGLGIDIGDARFVGAQTSYALTLMVSEGAELNLSVVFDRSRFDGSDVRRIADDFVACLRSIADRPDSSVAAIRDAVPESRIPRVRPPAMRGGYGRADAAGREYVAPRDPLELQLARMWESILGVRPIGVRDSFFALGGHSLLVLQLMARIQKAVGKRMNLALFFQGPTIERQAAALRGESALPAWSHLVAMQPDGAGPPLFLVHPLGGNVMCYADLVRRLGPDQPCYALQARGMEAGREPFTSIREMAAAYIDAVRTAQARGPYHLAGYSFGGFVVYEMARQLLERGQAVRLAALLDTPAPGVIPLEMKNMDDAGLLVSLFSEDLSLPLDHLRALGPDEQLEFVLERARGARLIPPDIGLDQARRLFRVSRTNHAIGMNYSPEPYPGRIMLLRAGEEPDRVSSDPALGWGDLAEAVDITWVSGRHENMLREPHVGGLAGVLAAAMG